LTRLIVRKYSETSTDVHSLIPSLQDAKANQCYYLLTVSNVTTTSMATEFVSTKMVISGSMQSPKYNTQRGASRLLFPLLLYIMLIVNRMSHHFSVISSQSLQHPVEVDQSICVSSGVNGSMSWLET